jgi:DNA excision repair protein ERCC-3
VQTQLPREIESFVRECTQNYGKVKLVLQKNRFFLESAHPDVLRTLLKARLNFVPECPACDVSL